VTVCAISGCTVHYGCILKRKGIYLSADAVPNRTNMRPSVMNEPSWEKGILTEDRAGYKVPVLNADLSGPVGLKEYSENRHAIDAARQRQIEIGA